MWNSGIPYCRIPYRVYLISMKFPTDIYEASFLFLSLTFNPRENFDDYVLTNSLDESPEICENENAQLQLRNSESRVMKVVGV